MKNLLTTKSRNTNVYYKVLQRFSKICGATYLKDRTLSMQDGGRKVYKKGPWSSIAIYWWAIKYFWKLLPQSIFLIYFQFLFLVIWFKKLGWSERKTNLVI